MVLKCYHQYHIYTCSLPLFLLHVHTERNHYLASVPRKLIIARGRGGNKTKKKHHQNNTLFICVFVKHY